MTDLVQILRDNDIGNVENTIVNMKEIVADSIAIYLQDNDALISLEVKSTLIDLANQRVIKDPKIRNSPDNSHIFHGFYRNFHIPGVNSNPYITFNQNYKNKPIKEPLAEAEKLLRETLQKEKPGIEIDILFKPQSEYSWVQKRSNSLGIHIYYTDEEKLPEFLVGKLKETHRTYIL